MRRLLLLSILPLAAIGCADNSATVVTTTTTTEPPVVGPPAFVAGSRLSLFKDPGKTDSDKISVGDPYTNVEKVFPASNAEIHRNLPKGFKDYSGSYFGDNGSSFGVIYYRSPGSGPDSPPAVALAMKYETNVSQDDVNSTIGAYTKALEPPVGTASTPFDKPSDDEIQTDKPITSAVASYYFWEDTKHSQRLMICSVQSQTDKTKLNLTVALGDVTVMNKLRMEWADAKKDSEAVQPLRPALPGSG